MNGYFLKNEYFSSKNILKYNENKIIYKCKWVTLDSIVFNILFINLMLCIKFIFLIWIFQGWREKTYIFIAI